MSHTGYLSPNEGCGTHRKKKVTLLYIVISNVFMSSALLLQLYYTIVQLCQNIHPRELSRQLQRPYRISHAVTHEVVNVRTLTPLTSECVREGNEQWGTQLCVTDLLTLTAGVGKD